METPDLIQLLSRRAQAVDRRRIERRWAIGIAVGVWVAALVLWWGLPTERHGPMAFGPLVFWLKAAFAALLGAVALALAMRLGRPGMPARARWLTLALPLSWLAVTAVFELARMPADERRVAIDAGWHGFVVHVLLLCVPTFAAALWCMRGQAPTRLVLAGASAGALAGALATLICTLFGLDLSMPPWHLWHVLGVAVPMLAGALLGPVLLRW